MSKTIKKYCHIYAIAFSVDSNREYTNVTEEELTHALLTRVKEIYRDKKMKEICGPPFESEINPEWERES